MASVEVRLPRQRLSRGQLLDGLPPRASWTFPLQEHLGALYEQYLGFKLALDLWCDGVPEQQIIADLKESNQAQLKQGALWRMFNRCTTAHPTTGKLVGYWGCVPNWSPQAIPTDPAKSPYGKQLTKFFVLHPDIEKELCVFAIGGERRVAIAALIGEAAPDTTNAEERPPRGSAVGKMQPLKVWAKWMSLCRDQDLHLGTAYPFDRQDAGRCGKEAIRRWYKRKSYLNPTLAAKNQLGEEVGALAKRDYNRLDKTSLAKSMRLVYEEVQLDEWKTDGMWAAFFPLADGRFKPVDVRRLWTLGLIDSESK